MITNPVIVVALIGLIATVLGLVSAAMGALTGFFVRAYFQQQAAPALAVKALSEAMTELRAENCRLNGVIEAERKQYSEKVALLEAEIAELRGRMAEYEKTIAELSDKVRRMGQAG